MSNAYCVGEGVWGSFYIGVWVCTCVHLWHVLIWMWVCSYMFISVHRFVCVPLVIYCFETVIKESLITGM